MNAVRAAFALASTGGATKVMVPLFSHYTTAGTNAAVEQDLYSDTLAAGQFANNGDTVYVDYCFSYPAGAGTTRTARAYVAGTQVFITGPIVTAGNTVTTVRLVVVREDASTLRVSSLGIGQPNASGTAVASVYTRITGLALSGSIVIKCTGQSSAATVNDVSAVSGVLSYLPAP